MTIRPHADLPEWGHLLTTPGQPQGWVLTAGTTTIRGREVVWVEVVDDYHDADHYAALPTDEQDAVDRRLIVMPAADWLAGLDDGSITIG